MSKLMPASIIAFVLLWPAAAVRAQTSKDEAMSKFREGVQLFENERFLEAVRCFRRANELNPSWKIEFNIGQCEAALKRYGLAMEAFEKYLALGGDEVASDRRDFVVAELKRLREMVGNLEVKAPDGVAVFVDGEFRGQTPMDAPIRVTAGVEHEVVFGQGGRAIGSRRVSVGSAQTVEVEPPSNESAPESEPLIRLPEPETVEADEEPGRGLSPVYFWIGVAATGAFGVGTISLELAVRSKWKAAEADPENQSLKKDGETLQALGIASLCLTGAAAVTTAVLLAFTDFGRGERMDGAGDDMALAPALVEGGGGVVLRGRF